MPTGRDANWKTQGRVNERLESLSAERSFGALQAPGNAQLEPHDASAVPVDATEIASKAGGHRGRYPRGREGPLAKPHETFRIGEQVLGGPVHWGAPWSNPDLARGPDEVAGNTEFELRLGRSTCVVSDKGTQVRERNLNRYEHVLL